jgi:hypothetical protein
LGWTIAQTHRGPHGNRSARLNRKKEERVTIASNKRHPFTLETATVGEEFGSGSVGAGGENVGLYRWIV